MCGITGIIDIEAPGNGFLLSEAIANMNAALVRRGPDDEGAWVSSDHRIALGQRRLAVLELSELGHQPIASSSGRYVMTFNGEIYNFVELGDELSAYRDDFAPTSDTQVLMASFEQWGIENTLARLNGMFAILCFDQQKKVLHLARDRLGEKPLYIGCHEGKMLFASELKAMHGVFKAKPELDRQSLTLFLRHGYVPAPRSIYQGIFKLPPGAMLSVEMAHVERHLADPKGLLAQIKFYWGLPQGPVEKTEKVPTEAEFESLLTGTVARQMRADVGLGAFLSGGVDSSTIVALMQRCSDQPVRTFSIGFETEAFNEAPYAAAVASHLNTDHHEHIVSANEVMDIIPDLAQIYDEPFADSSQLPTIIVSRMARQHVTVCLSGDGGDELFGGYERYHWAEKLWTSVSFMPHSSRVIIASIVKMLKGLDSGVLPSGLRQKFARVERLAQLLPHKDRQRFYRALVSSQTHPEKFVLGGEDSEYGLTRSVLTDQPYLHQMMYLDIHNYLPDDILTKVDRASMYSSLELRAPLLDHHVVEAAWKMRPEQTNYQVNSKAVLRKILYKHVPQKLIERPKRGFAIPLRQWLRGPLKNWAEGYINPSRLTQEKVLNSDAVMAVWHDFQNGKPGGEHFLWNVLMFQLWHENWA